MADVIETGLAATDPVVYSLAKDAAPSFGIATFQHFVDQRRTDPLGHHWWDAWRTAHEPERIETLLGLAHTTFRPGQIDNGSASSTGFGLEFVANEPFDFTLQELRNRPGRVGDLVALGLRSPSVRNRSLALATLEQWPRSDWPVDAEERLGTRARDDPDETIRQRAGAVVIPEDTSH